MERRFDADYLEEVTLRDGTRARLRLVRPEDKPILERGFAGLSSRSRYLRFFSGKERLTAAELSYLTELDGESHLAIGALRADADEGLGVARFIRLPGEPSVAELAVAVVDEAQRKGLGRILCERVVEAARERGVERIRAEVLPSNDSALTMLRALMPAAELRDDGDAVVIDFPIPPPAPPHHGLIEELLAMAARGLLLVRRALEGRRQGGE